MAGLERRARAAVRRARAAVARRTDRRGPLVSVVVAVHGPAAWLGECLDSVLASAHRPVEVLLAADPADPRAVAAADRAPARPGVRRVRPSGDRSVLDDAVLAAQGELLCFADADDLVPAGAFPALVDVLTRTGADLALGSLVPPRAGRDRAAPWQQDLLARHDADRAGARTLADCPDALVDLALTDKMFRTAFWRDAGLTVPSWHSAAGTVARAYLAAGSFALTPAPVYEEQARDVSAPVEQQARFDPATAGERALALRQAAEAVQGHDPALLPRWLAGVLTHLLPPVYRDAVGGGADYLARVAPPLGELLGLATAEVLADVPVAARLGAWTAANGSLEDVALLQDHLADNPDGLPTVPAESGRTVAPPGGLGVVPPEDLLRVQPADRRLRARVEAPVRDGDRWRIDGAAFVDYVTDDRLPSVVLADPAGAQPRPLEVTRRTDPRLNLWAQRAWEDRSGSGFTCWTDSLPGPTAGCLQVEVALAGRHTTLAVPGPEAPAAADSAGAVPAVLDSVGLAGDVLRLTGAGPATPEQVAVRGPRGRTPAVAVARESTGFTAEVPLRTTVFGADVHLPAGRFRVELLGADGAVLPARWSDELTRRPPELLGDRVGVTLEPGAAVTLGDPLSDHDRSAFGQALLRTGVYAAPARTPYESMVLLETFRGRSVGDNPGALGRELTRRGLGLDLVWVTDDPSVDPPAGTRGVARRSREWHDALGRARVYVGNAGAPYWFEKHPGQVHLQTWHGTPLKRIGEDRGPGDFQTWRHRRRIAAQAAGWDALVSPSPFCSTVFRSAFRYDGPMLEVGYPRNDLLLSGEAPTVRARTRAALGLEDTDRVVLYAPTWREYVGVRNPKPLYLDAEALTGRLPDAVVLVRGHYSSTRSKDVFADHPRIHDVTRYPDIADLYLAADVLVTDYSSVMFDFALTDKPMVLLTPDLEQYREVERGFYFDLERRAPGPLVTSSDEVAEALGAPDRWAAARQAFRDEFCPWDDGRSSARAVDWLLDRL